MKSGDLVRIAPHRFNHLQLTEYQLALANATGLLISRTSAWSPCHSARRRCPAWKVLWSGNHRPLISHEIDLEVIREAG